MSIVNDLTDRKERPAYVRFERIAEEDKVASVREGRFVGRDVDMALITPPYSKDVFKIKVPQWFDNLKQDVDNGRISPEWVDNYHKQYDLWKKGEEIPLNGTPIKGWGVISPAQQEALIRMQVLTVEDLAAMNDEGVHRCGMGAMVMKNKAIAWLAQLKDKGPLTQEMAGLKTENATLKSSVDTLTRQVQELMAAVKQQNSMPDAAQHDDASIGASDILDDTEDLKDQYQRKFGKPPHHLMKPDTIRRALTE